ncbi:MAG: HAMP domain-containing histidine kinase [Merismopedia sp. SIO2A8]|nr:HAMP domain-containing histidine kinase [Merismopedia sp. SIO2A8]
MKRPKLGLRSRLFFSHILVMVVGLSTLIATGKISSPRFFIVHLQRIEVDGYSINQVRTRLLQGFESAWTRGAMWSIGIGATTAGGLSYLLSKRIVQPLVQMEAITQKLSSGQLDERVPPSEIPELNRLGAGFNQMAANLEGVEQRRRELVSDLTHELRTPLTILEGYLEGLSDGTVPASEQIYQLLTRETKRIRQLVDDLQELSKMEAGYLPIHVQSMSLEPLLAHLIQQFSEQLLDADSPTLEMDYDPSVAKIQADPARVEQILVNLISNAIRYTPSGSIKVRVWDEQAWVWVAVIDTGMGIAAEDLPHVFERFWRADRSRDRHSGGTGIGLAISRRLVELQGGSIMVQSELHKGSTFQFSLPMA